MADYCKRCGRYIDKYIERRSLKPVVSKIGPGHVHHGLPYYRHAICPKNHYTRLERTNVEWAPCLKCNKPSVGRVRKKRHKSVRNRKRSESLREESRRRTKSVRRRKKFVPIFLYKDVFGMSPEPPPPPPPPSPPSWDSE